MKKIVLQAGLLLIGSRMLAQPVLSHIEDFNAGHQMIYLALPGRIDEGKSGGNITWDFSQLNINVKDTIYQEIAPATAYIKEFPKANTVEKKSDGSLVIVEKTGTLNKVWGIINQRMTMNYEVPYTFVKRPFKYRDSVVSSPKRSYDAYGGYKGGGKTKTVADGWGTLVLPSGSYKVLRVRFEQDFTDISTANGSEMKTTVVSYAWFDEMHKGALLKMDVVKVTSPYYNDTKESVQYLLSEK